MSWEVAAYCWACGMCGCIYGAAGPGQRWASALGLFGAITLAGLAGRACPG
jgi:hypothetical protein